MPALTRIEDKLDAVADVGQETNDTVKLIARMLVERSGEQPTPKQLEHLRNQLADLKKELAAKDEVIRLKDDEINSWPQQLAEFKRERASRHSAEASKQQEEIGQKLDDFDFSGAGQLLAELIEKKEDDLDDLVVSLIDRAKVYELQFRWDQAIATRERAVTLCPDDTDLRFSLALLLAKQNQFDAAIDHYRQLIQQTSEDPTRAGYLNNLANLYSDTNRLEKAEQAYDEALELRRDLAGVNPNAYRPDVAMTLNNLANLYGNTNRLDLAEQAYEEDLELRRDLAGGNPDAYRPDVATTLNDLASLYSDTNRLEKAEQALIEGIKLLEPFYRANPGGRGDSWAKSHVLLAMVQRDSGDCPAAVATVARTREIVGWERYEDWLQQVEDGCGQ